MQRNDTYGQKTVAGTFPSYAEAYRAVEALRSAGYQNDHIGVFGPDGRDGRKDSGRVSGEERSGLSNDPTNTRWEEGSGIGAATGGLAGLGLGAAVAAGLMSPVGPIIAGGTLVAMLASVGAGATVGTVVGALAGAGVPEEEAEWHASELEHGRVVVTVRTTNDVVVRSIMDEHGATRRPTFGTSA